MVFFDSPTSTIDRKEMKHLKKAKRNMSLSSSTGSMHRNMVSSPFNPVKFEQGFCYLYIYILFILFLSTGSMHRNMVSSPFNPVKFEQGFCYLYIYWFITFLNRFVYKNQEKTEHCNILYVFQASIYF